MHCLVKQGTSTYFIFSFICRVSIAQIGLPGLDEGNIHKTITRPIVGPVGVRDSLYNNGCCVIDQVHFWCQLHSPCHHVMS